MDEATRFGLSILAWMISSTLYIVSSLWIIFGLEKESPFLLALVTWMLISGASLYYFIYIIGKRYLDSQNNGKVTK